MISLSDAQGDAMLLRPCPHQDCLKVLDQARDYVQSKLASRFLPSYAALGQTAEYQQVRLAIAVALVEGDLEATKSACRDWCKLVCHWTWDHQAAAEGGVR
jgi:hypothetical protein